MDYLGDVPFEGHLQVENPITGFLQNCNVAANVVTPGLTFTADDFPPEVLFAHYGENRARRARLEPIGPGMPGGNATMG